MGSIQRGAIRTFRNANPERMKDYVVGEDLDTNANRLKAIGDAVLGPPSPASSSTIRAHSANVSGDTSCSETTRARLDTPPR